MINAQDIKIGTAIRMDGKLYFCIDFLHVKPGKGNTFMRTKLKDVVDGYVLERRFNIGEKLSGRHRQGADAGLCAGRGHEELKGADYEHRLFGYGGGAGAGDLDRLRRGERYPGAAAHHP